MIHYPVPCMCIYNNDTLSCTLYVYYNNDTLSCTLYVYYNNDALQFVTNLSHLNAVNNTVHLCGCVHICMYDN